MVKAHNTTPITHATSDVVDSSRCKGSPVPATCPSVRVPALDTLQSIVRLVRAITCHCSPSEVCRPCVVCQEQLLNTVYKFGFFFVYHDASLFQRPGSFGRGRRGRETAA